MAERNLAAAEVAYPQGVPDWVAALAAACDRTSQSQAAEALGLSAATINQVVRGRYPAKTDRIEAVVRGRLMRAVVLCPALGELAMDLCQEWQAKAVAYSDASSLRHRMRRACRGCAHSRFTKEGDRA